jgi:hypothetical protein
MGNNDKNKTKKLYGSHHNGLFKSSIYNNTLVWAKRIRQHVNRDNFVKDFYEALEQAEIALVVEDGGAIKFVENKKPIPPSRAELERRIEELEDELRVRTEKGEQQ